MTTETNSVLNSVKEAFAPVTDALKNLQNMEVPEAAREFVKKQAETAKERAADLYAGSERVTAAIETAVAGSVTEAAKKLPDAERLAFLQSLPRELQIALPAEAPAEYEPMSWEEAREVAAGGIELGAHTCTHPILSRLASAQQLADEIAGSKCRIEEQLDRCVSHHLRRMSQALVSGRQLALRDQLPRVHVSANCIASAEILGRRHDPADVADVA